MACQDTFTCGHRPLFVHSDIYRRAAYGSNHPLAIPRVETAVDICRCLDWLGDDVRESPTATYEELTRYHSADYVSALRDSDQAGFVSAEARERYAIGTMENPLFSGVFRRASTAVGGSMLAAHLAMDGRIVFHPAGGTHHGRRDGASGFCYLNDPVFAVLTFLQRGLERVLYVDLDAHHGDGVEDAFADDPRVFTISVHETDRWPWTGKVDDRRGGRARNLPVPYGINDTEYGFLIDEAVLPIAAGFGPQAVVVTAGADPLAGDPLSKMMLSNGALWDAVVKIAHCAPAAVVVGGGGYNPWTLARFWAGLWGRISGKTMPDQLPECARERLAGLSCDLVDDEDVDPNWLVSLVDPPNPGEIRPEIVTLRNRVLTP